MKYHGLVLIALLSLSNRLLAQSGSADSGRGFPPPVPGSEQVPAAIPSNYPVNVDAELQQFRNEIRQFQSSCEEVARNLKTTDAENERVSNQQRQELLDLLTKLARNNGARKDAARRSQAAKQTAGPDVPSAESIAADQQFLALEPDTDVDSNGALSAPLALDPSNPLVTSDVADAFGLGKILFNKGDFANAEKAFRRAKVAPENEMTLKYLVATCQRRQARWRQAIEGYKVVAESDKDPVLQKLAKWQLDNIRWHQESESQLEQLRKQREKRTATKKNETANAGSSGQ